MEVREPSAKYLAGAAFKQTEVGDVPTDWNCLFVTQIVESRPNAIVGGPFGSDLVSKDYVLAGVPVIRGQNMGKSYVSGDFVFVSNQKAKQLQANLAKPGDLVFTQRGTLGQVSIVPPEPYDEYVVSQSQMKLSLNTNLVSVGYVFQYFSSPGGQRQIFDSAIQTGVPHTNLGILRSYQIPAPPTVNEQQAIATALSDADALIESLEQLLAKKHQIKQGAMQELLTAQRRLPGFKEEWVTKVLGDLADIRSGGTPSTLNSDYWDGDVLWCTPTDITALNGHKYLGVTARKITEMGLKSSSAEIIPAGSIVMTSRATIGECAINTVPLSTNQGFKNFLPFEGVDGEFLYYLLTMQKQGFIGLCGGSTFLEIGKSQLRGYLVRLPATKAEQTAIAQVLSEMDADIAAVEARLTKARAIKQGMMQELLTGRIRLV